MNTKLIFTKGNAKLQDVWTFSLPAGHTCPGARECMARVDRETGKLTDGKHAQFRCFAASMEARMPSVRKSRWNNFDLLRGRSQADMVKTLSESIPASAKLIRVHVSGDFFNAEYFRAWMQVASQRPEVTFYAYTKSVKIWVDNKNLVPPNFKLTASHGGTHDHLIDRYLLKYALVVFSVEQAKALGLEIDHDDSHAYGSDRPFALLLHGTQPKGSESAKALSALKSQGFTGYSKKHEPVT